MDVNVNRNGNQPATKRRNRKWTVMVYLAGDNNLTSNCITVLQQLEAVKYNKDVCVLACYDSNTPWPKGSRYLAINCKRRKNNKDLDWEIYNDLIGPKERNHDIEAPDFCYEDKLRGRPMKRTDVAEGLKRFIDWTMKNHGKSDHYMLVLYGHGPVVAGKTFLARENPLSSLRMKDLPIILAPHFGGSRRKLDILAFQNCAMNGIETAYEVKDQVKYMIGSQGLVLSYGWPYEKIISALIDNPRDSPLDITEKILKACARHLIDFSVMDRSSEQSVCDLSKLRNRKNIKDAIQELGGELQEALKFKVVGDQKVLEYPVICDAVRLARLEAQSFWGETFVDVYDFCERLLKKGNEAILVQNHLISNLGVDERRIRQTELVRKLRLIVKACMSVMERVEEMVPYSYYIGSELQYSRGLSIYFPWSMQGEPYSFFFKKKEKEHVLVTAFEIYSSYKFVKDSGWADFLKSFYRATLRKVRRADRKFSMRSVNESLSLGVVREEYKAPADVLTTEYLRKTESNSGIVDYEVWSNVKNYPRRNYVSPSDCPRTVDTAGRHRAGKGQYRNPDSPPISYLGWNICEFVADVIRRKPGNGNNGNHAKVVRPRQKGISRSLRIEPEPARRVNRRP
jgi:Clostripain family